jgi:hypothetical protein
MFPSPDRFSPAPFSQGGGILRKVLVQSFAYLGGELVKKGGSKVEGGWGKEYLKPYVS